MSYFKAKMHQIRFRRWGSFQRSPGHLAGFKGPTSKGRGGEETGGRGGGTREGRGRGPEGRGGGREGIGIRGGRGRRMGIAHPLFLA